MYNVVVNKRSHVRVSHLLMSFLFLYNSTVPCIVEFSEQLLLAERELGTGGNARAHTRPASSAYSANRRLSSDSSVQYCRFQLGLL